MDTILQIIQIILSILILIIAGITDIKTKKIPNIFSFSTILFSVCFFIVKNILDFQVYDFISQIILFFAVFFFGMSGYIGLGDIKILMAISMLNPVLTILAAVVIACIIVLIVDACKNPKKTIRNYRYIIMQWNLTKKLDLSFSEKKTIAFIPYLLIGYIAIIAGINLFV